MGILNNHTVTCNLTFGRFEKKKMIEIRKKLQGQYMHGSLINSLPHLVKINQISTTKFISKFITDFSPGDKMWSITDPRTPWHNTNDTRKLFPTRVPNFKTKLPIIREALEKTKTEKFQDKISKVAVCSTHYCDV